MENRGTLAGVQVGEPLRVTVSIREDRTAWRISQVEKTIREGWWGWGASGVRGQKDTLVD
jgi:hypothetical protein